MPLRNDISRVLVLGSGPTVVGQGAEFDYAGTQACLSLREIGVSAVVLNDNHASYMTTGECSDVVVIEPVTREAAAAAFKLHRCDAVMASFGGQIALNVGAELVDSGDVPPNKVLGTPRSGVDIAENRRSFAEAAQRAGAPCARHVSVSPETCDSVASAVGLPCIVRASYTLGGSGTRLCRRAADVKEFVEECFRRDAKAECVAESDLSGWVEIEFEIVRDCRGNSIAVCGMENVDPVGIHTGDSIVVAPIQTLDDELVQELRAAALRIADAVGVVGACNVQLAVNHLTKEWRTIECNPRTSRSSALASKATGYPIARVAAQLSLGAELREISVRSTGVSAAMEPAMDYVVVKIPAWSDDKFAGLSSEPLGSSMRATGESMGIGATFAEAYFKALRGIGRLTSAGLTSVATADRCFSVIRALLSGSPAEAVSATCKWRAWFVAELQGACVAAIVWRDSFGSDCSALERAKLAGVSDALLGDLAGVSESAVRAARRAANIRPRYRMIDGTAGERRSSTRYCYSTYAGGDVSPFAGERVALVVGSGPITIGQGIEFDCCAVEAIVAAKKLGWETAVINCNPETVSTDYDVSDTLVFDPIDAEGVDDVCDVLPLGSRVLAQFGGQRALDAVRHSDLASILAAAQVACADVAGDRASFDSIARSASLQRPKTWASSDSAIVFPVIVRPSHVIGGAGMTIARTEKDLISAIVAAKQAGAEPVTADQMLDGVELDVDVVRDAAGHAFTLGAVQQVDPPGVHSGDSTSFWPADSHISSLAVDAAIKIAHAAKVVGVANIQVIVTGGEAYPIELNARASRTVPFVERASGARIISSAVAALLAGAAERLASKSRSKVVKKPTFSKRLPAPALGPVMQSTGETMSR